jgi:rRNA maturation protein Nop10
VHAQQTLNFSSVAESQYIPRGRNELHRIFEQHFSDFCSEYDMKYATDYGKFRLQRIESVGEKFITCGDYLHGIARIRCQNKECGYDYFRPFSCKGFYLCPSCSQKRTLLLSEHFTEELFLELPHRQFVFTVPKVLRLIFRRNRTLFAKVSRLINQLISDFYSYATGRTIRFGMIAAHQTFGDMLRWNPHFHCIVLEGGFDQNGKFLYIPFSDLSTMTELFRRRVIQLLVKENCINLGFARNLLSWKHSGFSIDNSVRILDKHSQESLTQYAARPAVSLKKVHYEPTKGRVFFHTHYSDYFKENMKMFDALDFIAELTQAAWPSSRHSLRPGQHIPPKRIQLIRRYGLYASRTRGIWKELPGVIEHAPEKWKQRETETNNEAEDSTADLQENEIDHPTQKQAWARLLAKVYEIDPMICPHCGGEMKIITQKQAWARLLAKVYEIDPMICPHCGGEMKIIAVIQDTKEIKKIISHLIKIGRAPPGIRKADFLSI